MQILKLKFDNCYGIKKLEREFDFSKFKTFTIYAPNGVMKTSFAKIFSDYITKSDSRDQIFKREPYKRKITDENDVDIETNNFFVIKSFIDTSYTSDKVSTLLVRNELREKYEKALTTLDQGKKSVIGLLKINTSSSDCEKEILETFKDIGDNIFEILENISGEILKNTYKPYKFRYNDVFGNEVVKKFVEKNKENLQVYHDKYFEILGGSDDFFSHDGTFGTAQASEIAEAVAGDAFFNAGHKIALKSLKTISTSKELEDLINEQIDKVVNNPELRKQFDKIDKALRPKNIQSLKTIIENDKSLLLELLNYEEFQKNYWKSHLAGIKADVETLNELYATNKAEIEEIIQEANNQSDEWKATLDTFKRRFINLPFEIEVKNTKDSVLGLNTPELGITFIDHETGDRKSVERDFLSNNVLSQGERRAFYLLNVIFEIRARLLRNQETIFVVDDIADSFDYKNKYAIVEYLKDLSNEDNFYSIILTHNFDFFRTIQSRILTEKYKRSHSFIAEKITGSVDLIEAGSGNVTDPFTSWRNGVNDNEKHLIACVPFVRNLIDFKDGNNDGYKLLTHILHIKDADGTIKNSADITIADIESHYSSTLSGVSFVFSDPTKKVIDIIREQVSAIITSSNTDTVVLEDKIILAIGIRLKAEEYMWSKISLKTPIANNQTRELFSRYNDEFGTNKSHEDAIKMLERVNIMTPENIHLNSFMYEPILDMGINELKNLYTEVLTLK